ncbi:MAG: DUF429 domain-containing protein [Bacteroidia bacterium]
MHTGVDYGSKTAGTTVVAHWDGDALRFFASKKGQDADAWLLERLPALKASTVFFDAPLSLPGVYRDLDSYDDYFYRDADRALKAMSPMFLGGLTARAMRLRVNLQKSGVTLQETYPGWQARRLELKALDYKGKKASIAPVLAVIDQHFPFEIPTSLPDWHHVDSLLAMLGSIRFEQKAYEQFGKAIEGIVIV